MCIFAPSFATLFLMKFNLILSLLLYWLGSTLSSAQTTEADKAILLYKVSSLIEKQENKEAYKEANIAIGKYPNEPLFYIMRAAAITDISRKTAQGIFDQPDEKYKMALSDLNKARELNGDAIFIYESEANLHLMYQQYEKALECYDKLYILLKNKEGKDKKGLLTCVFNRAVAQEYLKMYDKAIDSYLEILEIEPKNENCYNNIANVYAEKKEYKKAYQTLDKGLTIVPTSHLLLSNYGFVYSEEGKHKQAIKVYDKLIADNNKQYYTSKGYYYNNRGYSKMQIGKLEAAMTDINESLKYYPENSYAFRNRGLLYLKMKQKDLACADFKKAEEYGFSKTHGEEVKKLITENCQ